MWMFLLPVLASGFLTVVKEGDVGIFYRFGSLLQEVHPSGWYAYMPFFTSPGYVNIRPQTDQVHEVSCGTSDGIVLTFSKVDVGNTLPQESVYNTIKKYGEDYDQYLIKDKIRHQMQVICSSMTSHEVFLTKFKDIDDDLKTFLETVNKDLETGLIIDFVRFPEKPILPESIKDKYLALTEEKVKQRLEIERQIRITKEAETEKMRAEQAQDVKLYNTRMDCRNELERANNTNFILLQSKKLEEEISVIDIRVWSDREKARAASKRNYMEEEARGTKFQLGVEGFKEILLMREIVLSIKDGSKFFFGEKMPNFLQFYNVSQ
jgi:regulator of protease activity HflC (stomatin/prohibitin superfamily)